MTITTRRKPRVHDAMIKTLASKILSGEFPEGKPLPPEAELCAMLAVSRGALREATRVLAVKGLLAPRPRVGTVVRPRDDWNLLDADLLTWSADLRLAPEFGRSLVEARQVIEPAAARFAALRATARDLAVIEEAFDRMKLATAENDVEAYILADIDFHAGLLRASHNAVFRQLSITVATALEYAFRANARRGRKPGESIDDHAAVLEHIRMRDPDGAAAALTRLLGAVAESLTKPELAEGQ
jgi:GntR family galactonate operon transcriptional repressor